MNILLIYPRNPDSFWSFQHVLKFVSKKSAFPPLGLLTVAAMLPPAWKLRLADLNVRPLADGDIHWADYVFLSGMIVHKTSAHEIAARCAALGKTVVAGGPLFTTGHAEFPEIRHFVLGEAENVAARLVADIERGVLEPFYQSPRWPDVRGTPVPRWDLIELRDYVAMPVQFSRGCPFNCEFCDIVVMNGRVPRTKEPAQVVRELEALRERGWRDMVFIVDDNFIGNRKRSRELLRELVGWRARTHPAMGFFTEASVNLADDAELCELMVQAGFKKVFLGIETLRPRASRNAASGRTRRATWATRCGPSSAPAWRSWAGSSSASTATRSTSSGASSNSSSARAWSPRWSACSARCRRPRSTAASPRRAGFSRRPAATTPMRRSISRPGWTRSSCARATAN